jgi:DNA invertase Pin-like site-specific DNA recombinase
MVKLNNDLKNEILEKFKNGSSTGSIMNEYKLSRSTVQRLKNEIYVDNNTYAS